MAKRFLTNEDEQRFVKSVNGQTPDEAGNVEIEIPEGGTQNAVQFVPQNLTPEQQEQARKNIGAISQADLTQCGLTKAEKNLILVLFENATYTSDTMGEIFSQLKSLWNGGEDNPDEPFEFDVKMGTISYANNAMTLTQASGKRATVVPIGQYLEQGQTYRFSIGNLATSYYYGVQVFTAESDGLTFPYVYEDTSFEGVTARIVDTGWMNSDFEYTPNAENCILAVNFKSNPEAEINESNCEEILKNFVIEKVAPTEGVTDVAVFMHRSLTTLNDGAAVLSQAENLARCVIYAAVRYEKVFNMHNGSYWATSQYSPLRIPTNAVSAKVVTPDDMRFGAFIYEPHPTNLSAVIVAKDTGWIVDGSAIDLSGYNDGSHYLAANIAYKSNANIADDFDTSVLEVYFVDADGNRIP